MPRLVYSSALRTLVDRDRCYWAPLLNTESTVICRRPFGKDSSFVVFFCWLFCCTSRAGPSWITVVVCTRGFGPLRKILDGKLRSALTSEELRTDLDWLTQFSGAAKNWATAGSRAGKRCRSGTWTCAGWCCWCSVTRLRCCGWSDIVLLWWIAVISVFIFVHAPWMDYSLDFSDREQGSGSFIWYVPLRVRET